MSQLWGMCKEPSACSNLWSPGKIRVLSFLPSLVEASHAAWCGAPLEMKEGTIQGREYNQAAVLYRSRKSDLYHFSVFCSLVLLLLLVVVVVLLLLLLLR
jgi:hypothetical protein